MTHEREHDHAHAAADVANQQDDLAPGRSNRAAQLTAPAHPMISGLVQRKARDANGVAEGAEDAVASAASSCGESLPEPVMRKFESSLGADLSSVRVHTGAESAQAAESVGAKAYTVGQDIHFAAGNYDPSSTAGQHLLAHEVAHTVQQQGGTPTRQNKLDVSAPTDAFEHEADRAADAMLQGLPAEVTSAGGISRQIVQRRDGLVVPDDWNPLQLPKTSYQIPPMNYLAMSHGASTAPDDSAPMPASNLTFPEDPPPPVIPQIQEPGSVGAPQAQPAPEDNPISVPRMTPDNDGETGDFKKDDGPFGTGKIVPVTRRIKAGQHDAYHLECWNEFRGVMKNAATTWDGARPDIDEFNVAKKDDALKAVQDDLLLSVQAPDPKKGQTHGSVAQQAGKDVPTGSGKDPKFDVAKEESDALKALKDDKDITPLRTAVQNARDDVNSQSQGCVAATAGYQAAMAGLDSFLTDGQIDEEKARKERREKDLDAAKAELSAIKGYTKTAVTVIAGFATKLTEGAEAVAKAKAAEGGEGGAAGLLGKVKEKTLDFAIDAAVELYFGDKVEKCQRAVDQSAQKLGQLKLHKAQADLLQKQAEVAKAFALVRKSLSDYKIAWRTMAQAYQNLANKVSEKLKANPKTAKSAAKIEHAIKALPIALAIIRKLQAMQGHLSADVPYTDKAGTGFAMMMGSKSVGSYVDSGTQFLKVCGWIYWERMGTTQAIQYWSQARDSLQVIINNLYGMD